MKMTVEWFSSYPRGKSVLNTPKPYRVTFTIKPRGVRFNAPLTRKMQADNVEYVKIGMDGNTLVIMPSTKENGLKVIGVSKGSNAQVCSSPIGMFGESLTAKNFSGTFNETTGMYEFDLTSGIKTTEEACGQS
jgi:hypothetical protein